MTTIRRRAILSMISDIQQEFQYMDFKDCTQMLYNDNMITLEEMYHLTDWLSS